MELRLESVDLSHYLVQDPPIIDFSRPAVVAVVNEIKARTSSKEEQARAAFEVARDDIGHSFDSKKQEVTICAADVLEKKDGICFAKAHLLTTLLRSMGIPAGFCYQRVLRTPDPNSGFALHGLNALYLEGPGWFRLDPRGNKPGVDSQFSIEREKLAYPIRTELGEIDYPNVFISPLPSVIAAMESSKNSQELFFKRPEAI